MRDSGPPIVPVQLSPLQPGPLSEVVDPSPATVYVLVCEVQPEPEGVPETSSREVPYELSQPCTWVQVKVTPLSAPMPESISNCPAWTDTRYQDPPHSYPDAGVKVKVAAVLDADRVAVAGLQDPSMFELSQGLGAPTQVSIVTGCVVLVCVSICTY